MTIARTLSAAFSVDFAFAVPPIEPRRTSSAPKTINNTSSKRRPRLSTNSTLVMHSTVQAGDSERGAEQIEVVTTDHAYDPDTPEPCSLSSPRSVRSRQVTAVVSEDDEQDFNDVNLDLYASMPTLASCSRSSSGLSSVFSSVASEYSAEYSAEEEEEAEPLSVSFADSVVTEIRRVPYYKRNQLRTLFYTPHEVQNFKTEYRREKREKAMREGFAMVFS